MDLGGVVAITVKMPAHYGLDPFAFDIGPRETAWIEQDLPNVRGKGISIPDSEMEDLVPPEEETFEAERRKSWARAGGPLGHSHIEGVLRLE